MPECAWRQVPVVKERSVTAASNSAMRSGVSQMNTWSEKHIVPALPSFVYARSLVFNLKAGSAIPLCCATVRAGADQGPER